MVPDNDFVNTQLVLGRMLRYCGLLLTLCLFPSFCLLIRLALYGILIIIYYRNFVRLYEDPDLSLLIMKFAFHKNLYP